ncbi:MAG: alpha-L-fucosidase [Ruminococcaceae bacterium]|nr:alpha-L-fucosidase [Oscillospiraceae bacterium]
MNKVLFYNTYTEKYMEGLPTGNGRLAAMMLGTPEKLRIALNHEWMWRGENRFREQEDVSCHIGEVRELLLAGDFYKGTELANEYFGGLGGISGIKNRVDPYQPVGDLYVTFDAGEISDYTRSLSLESGLSSTSFNSKYGRISEDLFVSMADGCMVLKISSELSSNFSVKLTRIFDPLCTISYEDISDGLVMKGSFKDGISFEAHIKINTNGTFVKDNSSIGEISVKDASETLVLINIGTDAKGNAPSKEIVWPAENNFDKLFERHKESFAIIMGNSCVEIDLPSLDSVPTDKRIELFREGKDPSMPLLYFEYGRYLLASGSAGELPLNLQGKWNEDLAPAWDADYHLDINLQMCYWFSETLGMRRATEPLFYLIERYVPYGREMAKNLYGCKGTTFTLQTDVWGRVTPESKGWAVWVGGAPWLCQHLFMHWRYAKDEKFLKERCYPVLKECAEFFEDYLYEKDGELWIVPSQSPENRFEGTGHFPVSLCVNSAMDIQLVTELLTNAIESAKILSVDSDKIELWTEILSKLPKLTIDSNGRLNEWDKERKEVEPGHRHLSHLYGLHPSQLFERNSIEWTAAEKSLDARMAYGGGHTGWSRSWVACMMARLLRGEEAMHHLQRLICDFATVSLLDLHPPRIFQIDGNMGGTAAVCEMLMQSRYGELYLIPALPSEWKNGYVKNFCAQDALTVSFEWKDSKITSFTLESAEEQNIKVIFGDSKMEIRLSGGVPKTVNV